MPICERIFTKPKRETFNTVTQRLAHVAQESAVQPVIQGSLVKHSNEASLKSSGLLEDLTKKPVKRKKKSPTVRSGNTVNREECVASCHCKSVHLVRREKTSFENNRKVVLSHNIRDAEFRDHSLDDSILKVCCSAQVVTDISERKRMSAMWNSARSS